MNNEDKMSKDDAALVYGAMALIGLAQQSPYEVERNVKLAFEYGALAAQIAEQKGLAHE